MQQLHFTDRWAASLPLPQGEKSHLPALNMCFYLSPIPPPSAPTTTDRARHIVSNLSHCVPNTRRTPAFFATVAGWLNVAASRFSARPFNSSADPHHSLALRGTGGVKNPASLGWSGSRVAYGWPARARVCVRVNVSLSKFIDQTTAQALMISNPQQNTHVSHFRHTVQPNRQSNSCCFFLNHVFFFRMGLKRFLWWQIKGPLLYAVDNAQCTAKYVFRTKEKSQRVFTHCKL